MLDVHMRVVEVLSTENKMVEVYSNGSAKEISLPLNNLSRGVYLLELQGHGSRIEQSFSLVP